MMNTTMRAGGFFQDTNTSQQHQQEFGTVNLNGTLGSSLNSSHMGIKFKQIYGGNSNKEGRYSKYIHFSIISNSSK